MCRTSRELGAVESCRRLVRRQSWSLQLDDRRSDEPVDLERGELRSEEHTSELQSQSNLVCRLLLEKKNVFSRWQPEHGAGLAAELDALVRRLGASTFAAVILQPVSGTAGVLVPPLGSREPLLGSCP